MLVMFGVIAILIALICYSAGVWNQIIVRKLKPMHLILFWAGIVFDTVGTGIMTMVAGTFKVNIHGVTGILAIILMAFNAIWATIVLLRKDERLTVSFYKVSLFVWIIWLIPFSTGMFLNMK